MPRAGSPSRRWLDPRPALAVELEDGSAGRDPIRQPESGADRDLPGQLRLTLDLGLHLVASERDAPVARWVDVELNIEAPDLAIGQRLDPVLAERLRSGQPDLALRVVGEDACPIEPCGHGWVTEKVPRAAVVESDPGGLSAHDALRTR